MQRGRFIDVFRIVTAVPRGAASEWINRAFGQVLQQPDSDSLRSW